MIYVKIHVRGSERLLAACDEDLLGKIFADGEMRLKVSETFYGGELVSEDTFRERTRSVTVMNLVGERAVTIAQTMGHISEDATIVIGGVKHAQAVIM
ncbi:MAG: DUF424 family protein [Methanomassiliicoccaceae archaeon]|jgi:hypothetical protein|nr:DUF424 family protein [Methanomassiliicoccaceae archaeon]